MSSLAPLFLALTVHLLGGHGEAAPTSCLGSQAAVTSAWMSHSAHIVACDATLIAAEPGHEPIFGLELKNESSQKHDSRAFESGIPFDPSLSGSRAVRGPPVSAGTLSTGQDSVSRHAPRGPPTP